MAKTKAKGAETKAIDAGDPESAADEVRPRALRALVVDDDADTRSSLAELVASEGFLVRTAGGLDEAQKALEEASPDLVLVDLVLPDGNGLELLTPLESTSPGGVMVVITGHATVDSAVEALRRGASDYLTKPIDITRLKAILANVARTRDLELEIGALRTQLRKLGHFGALVGSSAPMQRVYELLGRVSPTEATVLITGETGTGKDVTAGTVHQLSRRRRGPFLALNCGAVSPNLIESELFGHERGSFTGADRAHRGYFERASQGTLFLDEIAEMPIELQVKLLRVLETGHVTRIGGERQIPVDVRVIAATNRRLDQAVSEGKLREDLLYRLKVFPINLPPLRDRVDDIELLVEHFLEQLNATEDTAKQIAPETIERLRAHSWPGNVRELRNVVHGAFILAEEMIGPECLPEEVATATPASAEEQVQIGPVMYLKVGISIAEAERRLILATLQEMQGDKRQAAATLGMSLKTLYNRLNAYESGRVVSESDDLDEATEQPTS